MTPIETEDFVWTLNFVFIFVEEKLLRTWKSAPVEWTTAQRTEEIKLEVSEEEKYWLN